MVVLYLPELELKLLERAETFTVFIVLAQVDNAPRFWLPANNTDGHAVVVFEPSVNFAHKRFAFL